jgi:hypothetical protein
MIRTLVFAAAIVLAAGVASAQTIDAKGHCHDAKGKMAPMSVCKPAAAAETAKKAPNCKKGKPCGNSCIAMDKVCHK